MFRRRAKVAAALSEQLRIASLILCPPDSRHSSVICRFGRRPLPARRHCRDESDAVRMQPAPDAERIDTTDLEVDDVVTRIEQLVQERLAASQR